MLSPSSRLEQVIYLIVSFVLALSLWYMLVGSEQVEAQVEVRLDYKSQPDGLVVREGLINRALVRLRGPAELLRGLHSRDLSFTVNLSGLKRGANVLPLNLDALGEFKAYDVVDVNPSRLVIEADALMQRALPLSVDLVPLPEGSPYSVSNVLLDPPVVSVRGPESLGRGLENLSVRLDPAMNLEVGAHVESLAVEAPDQLEVTPPVATLRYTLALKTTRIDIKRMVQMDSPERDALTISPQHINLSVEVPEGKAKDAAYLAAIRVVVRQPDALEGNTGVPVLVVLPSGSRLVSVDPATVSVSRKKPERFAIENS